MFKRYLKLHIHASALMHLNLFCKIFIDGFNRQCLVRTRQPLLNMLLNFQEEKGNEQAEFPLEGGNGLSPPTSITLPLYFFRASIATSVEMKRWPCNCYHLMADHMDAQRELFASSDVQELSAFLSQCCPHGKQSVYSGPLHSCFSFYIWVRTRENVVPCNLNSLGCCKQVINSSGLHLFLYSKGVKV